MPTEKELGIERKPVKPRSDTFAPPPGPPPPPPPPPSPPDVGGGG